MSDRIIELTSDNFESQVMDSDTPVLVDFWAAWCAPCRMIAPIVEELADEYEDRLTVGKLDVDEHSEIAARFNVRGIPTLLVFANGQVQDQMVGAGSKDSIKSMVDKAVTAQQTA